MFGLHVPQFIQRRWRRRIHRHLIDVVDHAVGVPGKRSVPLTAFKWRCVLCGQEIIDVCEPGYRQLEEGHSRASVFRWGREGDNDDSD